MIPIEQSLARSHILQIHKRFSMTVDKKMTSARSTIKPGCIACGPCEFIAPEVFKVTDTSRVIKGANLTQHEQLIKEAAKACPVQVIKLKEE